MPLVSVVRAEEDRINEAVGKAIDLIGGLESLRGRKNISIKPNLCQPKSSYSGATTNRQIIEALIEKINSVMHCRINVVEADNSKESADKTFVQLGYDDLSLKYSNVRCINLSRDTKIRVHIGGSILSTLVVPESMLYSDCLISVAKLKTHVDHLYSGVLKNQYGFILSPGRRPQYHGFMSEVLSDLNSFYRPDLSIIDGLIGMEGFGPVDGTPRRVGVIIASRDPVAADAVGATIIGIRPARIGYLKYAEKKRIGTWKNIEVVGCDIDEVATSFSFIPNRYYYLGRISLALQRHSRYVKNFADFVRLTRSALTTVGLSAIEKRMSYLGLWRLATDITFRLDA